MAYQLKHFDQDPARAYFHPDNKLRRTDGIQEFNAQARTQLEPYLAQNPPSTLTIEQQTKLSLFQARLSNHNLLEANPGFKPYLQSQVKQCMLRLHELDREIKIAKRKGSDLASFEAEVKNLQADFQFLMSQAVPYHPEVLGNMGAQFSFGGISPAHENKDLYEGKYKELIINIKTKRQAPPVYCANPFWGQDEKAQEDFKKKLDEYNKNGSSCLSTQGASLFMARIAKIWAQHKWFRGIMSLMGAFNGATAGLLMSQIIGVDGKDVRADGSAILSDWDIFFALFAFLPIFLSFYTARIPVDSFKTKHKIIANLVFALLCAIPSFIMTQSNLEKRLGPATFGLFSALADYALATTWGLALPNLIANIVLGSDQFEVLVQAARSYAASLQGASVLYGLWDICIRTLYILVPLSAYAIGSYVFLFDALPSATDPNFNFLKLSSALLFTVITNSGMFAMFNAPMNKIFHYASLLREDVGRTLKLVGGQAIDRTYPLQKIVNGTIGLGAISVFGSFGYFAILDVILKSAGIDRDSDPLLYGILVAFYFFTVGSWAPGLVYSNLGWQQESALEISFDEEDGSNGDVELGLVPLLSNSSSL
jgi:hypothetical protein